MERKQCYLIDRNNNYNDIVVALFNEDTPICLEAAIGTKEIPDGYIVLPMDTPENKTSPFVKAHWTGTVWEEGATAKEIAAWEEEHPAQEPVVSPPSQLDSIEAQAAYTAMMTNTLLEG